MDVRTSLILDDDVTDLLHDEVRRSGEPFALTANRLLRSGLKQAVAPAAVKAFKVRGAIKLEQPEAWTSGCVQELLDMLDGSERR